MKLLNIFTTANYFIIGMTIIIIFLLLIWILTNRKKWKKQEAKEIDKLSEPEQIKQKRNNRITNAVMVLFLGGLCYWGYSFYDNEFTIKRNEFDIVDKENEKLISLFNTAYNGERKMNSGDEFSPGCKKTAPIRIDSFFNTIKEIETYTKYGVASSRLRNGVLIKIVYADGKIEDGIWCNTSWSGKYLVGSPLLLKIYLENGKAKKILSNGVEKETSPDATYNPLHNIIENLIKFDMGRYHDDYFLDVNNKTNIKKEWDSVK